MMFTLKSPASTNGAFSFGEIGCQIHSHQEDSVGELHSGMLTIMALAGERQVEIYRGLWQLDVNPNTTRRMLCFFGAVDWNESIDELFSCVPHLRKAEYVHCGQYGISLNVVCVGIERWNVE